MNSDSSLPYDCSPSSRELRLSYERRTKVKHSTRVPPNRKDGTFTTRLHYNGVMPEVCGKQYTDGLVEYIHKCDPDRWSKLEVDDVMGKLGVDVTKVNYFFQKPGLSLDEGLVQLFDNNSSMIMVEMRLKIGVIDLYAVELNEVSDMVGANEVLVSQLTQEHVNSPMRGNVIRELVFDEEDKVDGVTADSEQDRGEDRDGLVDIWVEDDEVGVTVDEPVHVGVDAVVNKVTGDVQDSGENCDGPVDDDVDDRGEDSDEDGPVDDDVGEIGDVPVDDGVDDEVDIGVTATDKGKGKVVASEEGVVCGIELGAVGVGC